MMHIVELMTPRLDGKDHTRNFNFTTKSIGIQWEAANKDASRAPGCKPWEVEVNPMVGLAVHEL